MRIQPKKRRIEGKTNYLKRKRLLENNKSRIVIRKTNRYIIIEQVESKFAQDSVKLYLLSKFLLKYGWPKEKEGGLKSLGASYLTGFLFGRRLAKSSKNAQFILDTGLIRSIKGSRIYAAVKGIKDSGINLNCDPKVFPDENRIVGNSKDFFDKVKKDIEKE